MTTVLLPRQLSILAGGQTRLAREAATLHELIKLLCEEFPMLGGTILDGEGQLSPFVGVFINGLQADAIAPDDTPLTGNDTVQLVAAVAGG